MNQIKASELKVGMLIGYLRIRQITKINRMSNGNIAVRYSGLMGYVNGTKVFTEREMVRV